MKPADRRALVRGGGAVLAAVVLLRGLPWAMRSLGTLRTLTHDQQATLARSEDVLARVPAIRDSVAAVLGRIVALAPRLVDGRTSAEAQASLAGLVSLAASRHQLRVVRLEPLADSAVAPFTRVALHAELEGDVAGLSGLLRAVEAGDPLLSVPSFSVSAPAPATSHGAEALRIELDIAGYYLHREGR